MLVGGDDAPFGAVVGLLRAYLNDTGNRLAVDARLALAGHTGVVGDVYEIIPGLSLRFALATIYEALSADLDDEARYALDERLHLVGEDDIAGVRTIPDDPRLAEHVPTSVADPAAAAALAQFGDSSYG